MAVRSNATLRRSLIEGSYTVGVAVVGSTCTLEDMLVRNTGAAAGTGKAFGDGVVSFIDASDTAVFPSEVVLRRSLVRGNGRAGAASFASGLTIEDSVLSCNAFDIDLETVTIRETAYAAKLTSQGESQCGCGSLGGCVAQSSSLAPFAAPPKAPATPKE